MAKTDRHGEKRDGRKENATATQAALRAAGRRLFGRLGFDATSVGALCAEAGVTTGALYHHFGDKKGVFAAVAEELDASLVAMASQATLTVLTQGGSAWQGFMAAVDAFLSVGLDRELRRIGLVDAPAVLGADGWAAIRERHGMGAMMRAVQNLQALGVMTQGNPRQLAKLILGLLYGAIEALPDDADNADTALDDVKLLVRPMLNGLQCHSDSI